MIKIQNHQLGLYILSNMNTSIISYPVFGDYSNYVPKFLSIFIRVGKIYKQCLMLPYEAVQMKEPFYFHITFCAKTFFAEFSFAWIYQKNVDEKQSLAFQKKLVCRVAVEKVQMYIYISRFIPKYKSSNIFLHFSCIS